MMNAGHRIPITILICDDDEGARRLTRAALEEAHVANALCFVENGEQLLDYLYQRGAYAGETGRAPRPGLILLDLTMPTMGGRKALEVIRGDHTLRDIPVLILSKSHLDGDIVRSYEPGMISFISKPVTFLGLLEAMRVLGGYWLEIVELPPGSPLTREAGNRTVT